MTTRHEPLGAAAAFGLLVLGPGIGALALDSSPAWAALETRTYEIPPGPVATALRRFAEKSGTILVYDSALTRDRRTPGLEGPATVHDGLGKLLSGTGLSYSLAPGKKSIAIMLAQNDTGVRNDAGAEALPTIDIGAEQPPKPGRGGYGGAGAAQDPYNTSYQLPNASTGTKTDTPVMNTPLNVQTITQQVLKDQQVIGLDQALRNVSGVLPNNGAFGFGTSFGNIVLRGFNATTLYRDGVRLGAGNGGGNNVFINQQFANVANIEILKGPAATLYGLVEPGGIVNVVTKEPLNAPYYSINQQIGSFALYRTSLDATGPLTTDDALLYRFNMSYESNGAPFGSPVDLVSSESLFFAPVLKWNVSPTTWVKFEAEYNENRPDFYVSYAPTLNGEFLSLPRSRNYSEKTPQAIKTAYFAVTWSHQFDPDWSFKQQLAFRREHTDVNQVFVLAPSLSGSSITVPRYGGIGYKWSYSYYSVNNDLVGHFDLFGTKHTLLVGGDVYLKRHDIFENYCPNGPLSEVDFFNPVHPGAPLAYPTVACAAGRTTQDTAGAYLQDQIELPHDVHVTAGARWQSINEASAYHYADLATLRSTAAPVTAEAVTPRFGLLWRPESWVSVYGNYSENFGANGATVYPGDLAPPSSARAWEAGSKLELFDGRLRATGSYFDLTKTNIATSDLAHPGFSIVTGEARSKGVELDIQGEIQPGWNVIATYTNQDVRVTKSNNGDVGQRLPHIPRNVASLWTTYDFQQDALRGLKIGGGVYYYDSRPVEDLSSQKLSPFIRPLPAYATVDLMTAYSFELLEKKVTAQLNISNLLDTTYYTEAMLGFFSSAFDPGLSAGFRRYGAPRTFRGSLRVEF